MARLKSRTAAPPGGFQFSIPQAGIINQQAWSFGEMVDNYLKIASSNPRLRLPTNRTQVENMLDEQNAARVSRIPNAQIYLAQGGVPAPPFPTPPPNLVKSAEQGNKLATGAELLRDWLGSGEKPVESALAESRAAVCAACPMNKNEDWTRIFTKPAAASIKLLLEIRHDMKLATTHDGKLEICSACLCPLRLKVFVPVEVLKLHTSPKQLSEFHEGCWIKSELA